ncbi:MAG TPA: apolipoprotein N-acyltransferase [bacterium]|nr:apolipoprotein N-acyltransferase [bacterium]
MNDGRWSGRVWSGRLWSVTGGLLLGFAPPPAVAPFAEWLVLPALMIWFTLATGERRPWWHCYLFGCAHMAWFSWSVTHAFVPPYFAIVLLGGIYYLGAAAVVRALPASWHVPGFALASAAMFWLRSVIPDIHYPHGQPCHAFWQTPWLLRSVAVGGEPLANALLAGVAAALVAVGRSWRCGLPRWRLAWAGLLAAVALWLGANLLGLAVRPEPTGAEPVRVHCVEPGYRPHEVASWQELRRLLRERLVAPSRRDLRADEPPDLIVWPESSWPERLTVADIDGGRARVPLGGGTARTRLVVGGDVDGERGPTPTALLVELPGGRILGRQDKQYLVPGGEFLPLLFLLPRGFADWLVDAVAELVGALPRCVPGAAGPPLATSGGVPFGTLMCYDNAFAGPARDRVTAGAQFLVVLSNESWFDGGGELAQLMAMSVVRALETATPVVRCTTDGWSGAIDADGRVLAELELAPAPRPEARILRVLLPRGPGRAPPMAWLQRLLGPLFGILAAVALAHALVRWVRIRTAKSVPSGSAGSGRPGPGRGGS